MEDKPKLIICGHMPMSRLAGMGLLINTIGGNLIIVDDNVIASRGFGKTDDKISVEDYKSRMELKKLDIPELLMPMVEYKSGRELRRERRQQRPKKSKRIK